MILPDKVKFLLLVNILTCSILIRSQFAHAKADYVGNPAPFDFSISKSDDAGCGNTFTISQIKITLTHRNSVKVDFEIKFIAPGGFRTANYSAVGTIANGTATFPSSSSSNQYYWCDPDIQARRSFWQPSITGINFGTSRTMNVRLTVSMSGYLNGSGSTNASLYFAGEPGYYYETPFPYPGNAVCSSESVAIIFFGDSHVDLSLYIISNGVALWVKDVPSDNGFAAIDGNIHVKISDYFKNLGDFSVIKFEVRGVTAMEMSPALTVFNPLPSGISLTTDKGDNPLLCESSSITLSVKNAPGNIFTTWLDGSPFITNPETKTYNADIRKTNGNGINVCPSVRVSTNVRINAFTPTISTPPEKNKCAGETIDLTASPEGAYAYEWKKPDGTSAGNSRTIQAGASGIYSVTVKPTSNNCPAQPATSVALNFSAPIVNPDIEPSNLTKVICGSPDPDKMILTAKPAGIQYSWQGGGLSSSSQTLEVKQAGRYTVTLTSGACRTEKFIDIQDNVYDKNIADPPKAFCADQPITLVTNSNDANRFDYSWFRDGTDLNSHGPSLRLNANETGSWSFTVSIKPKGSTCSAKTSEPKTVEASQPISNENIILPPKKSRAMICGDPELSILLTAPQDNVTYSWQGPGVSNATGKTLSASQEGNYTLTMNKGACQRKKEMIVEYNHFNPNIAASVTAFCSSKPITLTAVASDVARFDYIWKRDSIVVGTNAPQYNLTGDPGAFTYTLEVTAKGTDCPAKKSAKVPIKTDQAITGFKINLPTGKNRAIICGGDEKSIELTAFSNAPTDGTTYRWQGAGTGTTPSIRASEAGDYKVAFTRGACTEEASVKVESGVFIPTISIPTATIITTPTDVRICDGEAATITSAISGTAIANSADNFTYSWLGGANATTVLQNQAASTLLVTTTGKYALQMTLKGSGCKAVDATPQNIKVTVDPPIKGTGLTPNPAVICNKTTGLTLTALSDSSAEGITYQWSGGGKADINPAKYIVSSAGTYSVKYTRGACTATAAVTPVVQDLTVTLVPPNASNPLLLCSGVNSIPMELKATSNLSTAVITWMKDGAAAPGTNNTGATYTPTQPGQYYAKADFNGVCTAVSNEKINTELLSNFSVSVTPGSTAAICEDKLFTLSASVSEPRFISQYQYDWTQDGNAVRSGSGTAYSTLSSGRGANYTGNTLILGNESGYTVKVKKDGCQATSAVNTVTLKPSRIGIIVLDYNSLQATESSDNKYQWYYKSGYATSPNDSIDYDKVPSATSRLLVTGDLGSYMVRANRNECGAKFSFAYIIDHVLASEPLLKETWQVYPNPAADAISVEYTLKNDPKATIVLLNASGQSMIRKQQVNPIGNYSLAHIPAGVYILEIQQGARKIHKKIVKQ